MTRHVESHMQRMCVGWFRLQYPAVGKLLFAVPNGGARSRTEAAIMKAEGVTAGVTDLILLLGRGGFNALCIEMKTTDRRSALSDAQIEWRSLTIANGNRHVVCRTLEEFQSEIRWYMARPANNEPRDEITCVRPIVPPSVEEIERAFGKIRRRKINHQPTKPRNNDNTQPEIQRDARPVAGRRTRTQKRRRRIYHRFDFRRRCRLRSRRRSTAQ